MLHTVLPSIEEYPMGYSNWLDLMLNYTNNFYEIVIVGEDAVEKTKSLQSYYIPNKLIAGSTKDQKTPLLESRYTDGETLLYTCVNNACRYPVSSVKETLEFIEK